MGDARNSRADTSSALKNRLQRWLSPPRKLRPTRAGWIFCVLTFGVGFAALNTGNNLLFLGWGMVLSAIVLSGILSEATLRVTRVTLRPPVDPRAQEAVSVPRTHS